MIPLIDIEPFLHGSQADKARTADALDEACREFGWLVVAGHGVPNIADPGDARRLARLLRAAPLGKR